MSVSVERRDRLPPRNLEAERSLLGSILWDNSKIDDVADILRADEFYQDSHGSIWRAILATHNADVPIDIITLSERLSSFGILERVGGEDYLEELAQCVPHGANAEYYARIIHEKAIKRRVITVCASSMESAYSNEIDSDSLLCDAEEAILGVSDVLVRSVIFNASDLVNEGLARLDDRLAGNQDGLLTGYGDLDGMLLGIQPGQYVIVGARPSQGKTALALNIVARVVGQLEQRVLFFSLEMSRNELIDRWFCMRSGVPGDLIKWPRGRMEDSQVESVRRVAGEIGRLPFLIDDTPGRTMAQIAAITRREKRHGLSLVVIDYLSCISGDRDKRGSREEFVAQISRDLKNLARKAQVPVIVLHQLNRQLESRPDHKPRMSDLRESGQIEQDADIIMLLHRPEYYDEFDRPGIAQIEVAKNRTGRTGMTELVFQKALTRFDSLAP